MDRSYASPENRCALCGGSAGRLRAGAHVLCTELAKHGLPTPSLGERCAECNGTGRKLKSAKGLALFLDQGPARIKQAIEAWAPKCAQCNGTGVQQP